MKAPTQELLSDFLDCRRRVQVARVKRQQIALHSHERGLLVLRRFQVVNIHNF